MASLRTRYIRVLEREKDEALLLAQQKSVEVETLQAKCESLDKENKALHKELLEMSKVDVELVDAQRRLDKKLANATVRLEEEAAELRKAIAKKAQF